MKKKMFHSLVAAVIAATALLVASPVCSVAADSTAPVVSTSANVDTQHHVGGVKFPEHVQVPYTPSNQQSLDKKAVTIYKTQKDAINAARNYMKARVENFTIYMTDNVDPYGILDHVDDYTGVPTEGDYIRWQTGGRTWSTGYEYVNGTYVYALEVYQQYYTSHAQEVELDAKVNSFLAGMNYQAMDTYQKVNYIYTWITQNVKYDTDFSNDYYGDLNYTAYGAMIKKDCVCQGYANLMSRLCLEVGVECHVVVSDSHAWNCVKMGDGKFYLCDATWDYNSEWDYNTGTATAGRNYFLKGSYSSAFSDYTHWISYSECPEMYDITLSTSDYDFNFKEVTVEDVTIKKVENVVGGQKISWTWSPHSTGYQVWRKQGSGAYKLVKTVTGRENTSVTLTGYTSGATYSYTIIATKGAFKSEKSPVVSKYYLGAATISSIQNTSTGIKLTWGKINGCGGYVIYKRVSGTSAWTKHATVTGGSTLTFTDNKSIASGTAYQYCVRPYAGSDCSVLGANIKGIIRVGNGKISELTNMSTGIKITWNAVSGVDGYYVYRKGSNGSYTKIATVKASAAKAYTDTAVVKNNGVIYEYVVKPYKGAFSGAGITAKLPRVVAPATVTVTNPTAGKVTVKWTANPSATGYEVACKATGSNATATIAAGTTTTSFTGYKKGTTVNVYVRAYRVYNGKKIYSVWSPVTTLKTTK